MTGSPHRRASHPGRALRKRLVAPVPAVALAVLASSAATAPARADRAAMLPAGGDDRLPPELRERAVAALIEALEAEGVEVIGPTEVARRLGSSPLRACRRTDCADDLARRLGVDFAAGVAVWAAGSGEDAGSVAVSLVTPSANTFPGAAAVERDGVTAAARLALASARDRQRLGPGPWLQVRGEPPGAQVLLDGTPVGVLPHRGSVAPGRHELAVRLEGFRAQERTLDVPLGEHEEVVVEVRLEPTAPASSGARTEGSQADPLPVTPSAAEEEGASASPWNWAVAGLLGAGAVGLLVPSLTTLVRDGEVTEETGSSVTRVDFGVRSALFLGVGVALLGSATFMAFGQPIDARASVDHRGGRLELEARF